MQCLNDCSWKTTAIIMNQIIKPFLFLTFCFLASNCIKVEKCTLWNHISKCFTHCYETKPNGTYCCSDTLILNDFSTNDNSEVNFEKCVIYSEKNEHNFFLLRAFVLSMGLLISIPISITICFCCAHIIPYRRKYNGAVLISRSGFLVPLNSNLSQI